MRGLHNIEKTSNVSVFRPVVCCFYFGNFQPPKYLLLKKGCPVMLLKNITKQLVNGLIGVVEEMADQEVMVNFKLGGRAAITKCGGDSVAKKTVQANGRYHLHWQLIMLWSMEDIARILHSETERHGKTT